MLRKTTRKAIGVSLVVAMLLFGAAGIVFGALDNGQTVAQKDQQPDVAGAQTRKDNQR